MFTKIKAALAVLVSILFCMASVIFIFRNHEPECEWRVDSIKILPVTGHMEKLGYNSKVEVIIYPTSKPAPKVKNGVLAGGEIICEDARFILSQTNATKILQQKPGIDINVGLPAHGSTVSFLYNKENLPEGKIIFQGTIKGRSYYNIHELDQIRSDFRDFHGVPVKIRIQ